MNLIKILLMIIFCFLILACAKTEKPAEELKTETESISPDTVVADTLLNELGKATDELKKKAEDTKKEIDELLK
jgi:hypothetical protein